MSRLFSKSSIFAKLITLSLIGLYLLGYQPALRFPPIQKAVVRAEGIEQSVIATPTHPVNLPHPGYISTRFSNWHPGVDIATGFGMPINPILPGKVVEAIVGFWGLGHYVSIEHEANLRSTYGHMGRIYVQVGDNVDQSTIIGTVGMTGRTSGPHTHLEISRQGDYIDPLTILPNLPDWPDPSAQRAIQQYAQTYPVGGSLVKSTQPNNVPPEVVRDTKVDLKKELKFSL